MESNSDERKRTQDLNFFVSSHKPNINKDFFPLPFWLDHFESPVKEELEFLETPEAKRIVSMIRKFKNKTKDDSSTRTQKRSNANTRL